MLNFVEQYTDQYYMKKILLAILLAVITIPSSVLADSQMEDRLKQVDASLDLRDVYDQRKQERITRLKNDLPQAKTDDRYFEQLYYIYDAYKNYCYDSAYHYACKCMEEAVKEKNDNRIIQSKLAMSFSLTTAGIISEAHEILNSINRSTLDESLLNDYYQHYWLLWRNLADYVGQEPYYSKFIKKSNAYLDSLIQRTPENTTDWWSLKGSLQMREHHYQDALESFGHVMDGIDKTDLHMRATTTAEMAWAYIFLDNEDKAIDYFAQSAIADNESATREITALYHLARFIYKRDEYDRASRYVHQALEDINFYNSRLRKVEINDILPIIEQDRYNAVRSQRNWLIAASVLFVVLIVLILCAYVVNHRKNLKLAEARNTISNQLEQLKSVNDQLREADKIKNAYIGRSFYTNAEYIEKVEKLYLSVERKIATRQYDELRSMMRQSAINAERENMYEAFDQTFLKLFPEFVERYNQLFEEKDRRMPPNDHSLTSEMRIFALIRLGISDSERIAKFLDYSVHTVNTYKTRIKNRSIVENDNFEQLIMEL